MIEKGVVLWLPKMEEVEKSTEAEVDPVYTCSVSYPARVNAAKVLIEVENYDVSILQNPKADNSKQNPPAKFTYPKQ